MAYPKKHITGWFTTSEFRAINLALVTDVLFHKVKGVIDGAQVYQAVPEGTGQASLRISTEDAHRLFDLLC